MAYHSITFGDYNTWDDWHLIPKIRPVINLPEEKTITVTVPGRNGYVDLSQGITGYPTYKNREGELEFYVMNDHWSAWYIAYSEIMRALQGKRVKVILEDDPGYYYYGLVWVSNWSSDKGYSTITFSYNLEPFKRSLSVYTETHTLSGSAISVLLQGSAIPVKPAFLFSSSDSSSLSVSFSTSTYGTVEATVPAVAGLGNKSVGDSVYLKVDGSWKEFVIVHKGLPSSDYDESCNGVWLKSKTFETFAGYKTATFDNVAYTLGHETSSTSISAGNTSSTSYTSYPSLTFTIYNGAYVKSAGILLYGESTSTLTINYSTNSQYIGTNIAPLAGKYFEVTDNQGWTSSITSGYGGTNGPVFTVKSGTVDTDWVETDPETGDGYYNSATCYAYTLSGFYSCTSTLTHVGSNNYATAGVQDILTACYSMLDSSIRPYVQSPKLPYSTGDGTYTTYTGANGIEQKVFILSATEMGLSSDVDSNLPVIGAKLDYFDEATGYGSNYSSTKLGWPTYVYSSSLQIVHQMTRTPYMGDRGSSDAYSIAYVYGLEQGTLSDIPPAYFQNIYTGNVDGVYYFGACLILPESMYVDANDHVLAPSSMGQSSDIILLNETANVTMTGTGTVIISYEQGYL